MADPQYAKYPDLSLAQDIFHLSNPSCSRGSRQSSLKKLQNAIAEHKMAPLYRHLAHPAEGILNAASEGIAQQPTSSTGASNRPTITSNLLAGRKLQERIDFPWDEKLYESLRGDNKKELEAYQKEEEEAAEAAGETEVQAAQGKRAEFWARVGDKVPTSIRIYEKTCCLTNIIGWQGYGDCIVRSRPGEDQHPGDED
jgi:26S proteasome regulatory subunit N7